MNDPRIVRALGVAIAVLAVLIAVLWLWPSPSATPEIPAVAATAREAPVPAAAATAPPERPQELTADDLPEGVKVTSQCKILVDWHRQRVPPWVLQQNAMAQGMRFDEDDLACMTAAGLPVQVLDYAEQNVKRPEPPAPE